MTLVEAPPRNNSEQPGGLLDEAPARIGVPCQMSSYLLLGHRNDDLLASRGTCVEGKFRSPIHLPGLGSTSIFRIPFPGKK